MSKEKNKTIRRLGKAHIWPSVVFFIISLVIALLGFAAFVILTTSLIAQERFDAAVESAISVGNSLDAISGYEKQLADSIEEGGLTESMFVFDKDGNVIAGFGTPSYDKSKRLANLDGYNSGSIGDPHSNTVYPAYADTSPEPNLIDENGEPRLDKLLTEEGMAKIFEQTDSNSVVFEARFWIEYALSDGRSAMIKCTALLRFVDFNRSLIMGLVALVVMLVPIIFFFVNVTISIKNQRRTRKLLYTDPVTEGSSNIYFEHEAGQAITSRANVNRLFLIADLTLMKYRGYCNYHGVRAGEALLEEADKMINRYLEKGEVCAHSGKASFALFLRCTDKTQGEERVRKMVNELSEGFRHGGIVFHAGIYFIEAEKSVNARLCVDPADCFSRASAARASLPDENVPALAEYTDMLLEAQLWAHRVEEKMQAALDNEEFKVYIQPKYDPVSEKLAGAEALIRWINEEDGFVPPGRFIPIFESNGFITKIDDYMLSHVAKLQADWIAEGKNVVPISVNVSRAHFANPNLAEHICAIIDEYKVPHHFIEIELTESAFFDDKAALLNTVNKLRGLGFEISMDDFGAGYSSLNSLKDLPLDVLKLDADFFRGEDEENRGEIVVSQAIRLAKSLNMRIVAEGIEKKEQVDFLAQQGCDMIQGYYFAKPMPADEYEKRLSQ